MRFSRMSTVHFVVAMLPQTAGGPCSGVWAEGWSWTGFPPHPPLPHSASAPECFLSGSLHRSSLLKHVPLSEVVPSLAAASFFETSVKSCSECEEFLCFGCSCRGMTTSSSILAVVKSKMVRCRHQLARISLKVQTPLQKGWEIGIFYLMRVV